LPAVVVNIKDSVYGRVFTLIHEFTHILMNRGVTERSNAATEERLKSGHAVGGLSIV
jgi:Zn-dependent peptidase ImmA (M78 family)